MLTRHLLVVRSPCATTVQCPREFPEVAAAAGGFARTTRSTPVGMPGSRSATSARSRRLVRLRTTAPPTALDTTKPTRGGRPARASVTVAWTTSSLDAGSATPGGAHRRREVRPLAQSVRRRQHRRPQAESSERPLRRRAARMVRPARVRMRRRKPWVLARRRLFGWKVRLLTMFSHLRWWAEGPGGRGAGGVRRPSETHDLRGEAATSRARVTGMRKRPNHRPVNGTRERPRGSNQRMRYPGLGKTP